MAKSGRDAKRTHALRKRSKLARNAEALLDLEHKTIKRATEGETLVQKTGAAKTEEIFAYPDTLTLQLLKNLDAERERKDARAAMKLKAKLERKAASARQGVPDAPEPGKVLEERRERQARGRSVLEATLIGEKARREAEDGGSGSVRPADAAGRGDDIGGVEAPVGGGP
ncbi:MAG: hypothetical protein AAGD40_00505 [Pseudomonadota bacterium]